VGKRAALFTLLSQSHSRRVLDFDG
jgi:hypothetical protein